MMNHDKEHALPVRFLAARLEGRDFSRLTAAHGYPEPRFDPLLRDAMAGTVRTLMESGFRVIYGFAQGTEISLLFHPDEDAPARQAQGCASVLAATASAALSLRLGQQAVFDCRMLTLPSAGRVRDYFLRRQEAAQQDARRALCALALRRERADEAERLLRDLPAAETNALLLRHGLNFDVLPWWQTRGVGVWWADVEKLAFDPADGTAFVTTRRALYTEYELPQREAYAELVLSYCASADPAPADKALRCGA